MSWSLSFKGTRIEAQHYIAKSYSPSSIQAYALDAVKHLHENDLVSISGYGHLATGGTDTGTDARLDIKRIDPPKVEVAAAA